MRPLTSTIMKQLQSIAVLILVALLGLLLPGCNNLALEKSTGEGQAPMFTLPEAAGGEVSLATYQGKQPILLYFSMAVG